MDIEITFTQFNGLTKCLDNEVCDKLGRMLKNRGDIYFVESQYLSPKTIFAAHTDLHRIELLSAFIPVRRKAGDRCMIKPTVAKFTCIRQNINPQKDDWWHIDHMYGERGYTTFCINPLDIESVETFTSALGKHMLENLNSAHAYNRGPA